MPDISVIIPTYNRASLLQRALHSVFAQSLSPAEIIVVDDGSSDHTVQVVEQLSPPVGVALVYLHQPNRGPAAARNLGVRSAAGDWVSFLDSDDEFHRDKLELQYGALMEHPDFSISHTGEIWYRRGRHLNQKSIHKPRHGNIFKQCLRLCCVGMSTAMISKPLFERYGYFDETLRCCEDYDFWLRLAPFERFYLVEKSLTVKHGGRQDQVSTQFRTGMDRFRIQALARLINYSPLSDEQLALARQELLRKSSIYAQGCAKHGRSVEAAHYRRIAEQVKMVLSL